METKVSYVLVSGCNSSSPGVVWPWLPYGPSRKHCVDRAAQHALDRVKLFSLPLPCTLLDIPCGVLAPHARPVLWRTGLTVRPNCLPRFSLLIHIFHILYFVLNLYLKVI